MPTETQVQLTKVPVETAPCRAELKPFDFDRCYWSHSPEHPLYATQQTLYEELGQAMLEGALEGFNNCIFAYGQTGSGKSFSVLGSKGDARGLLPRVVEGLFEQVEQFPEGKSCKTLVGFMEIYNEQVRDLLASPTPDGKPTSLQPRQHPVLGVVVPGLTKAAVGSCPEVMELIEFGSSMRHVSATAMNATSSRSHCIFTVELSISGGDACEGVRKSQTHLVDLAGSERSGRTKATGTRLQEGNSINKSLTTLARVIAALAKNNKKKQVAPFRDSKLTFILKESLSGNSKTAMIAAISPNLVDFEETLSTLKFAQSAKEVRTNAVVNEVNEKSLEAQLRQQVEELKSQLSAIEGERSEDARRFSALQRKIDEQTQLLVTVSKDWDTLREEEVARVRSRASITQADIENLQKANGVTSDSETDSGESSSSGCGTSASEWGDEVSLLQFSDSRSPSSPAGASQSPKLSSIRLTGRAGRQWREMGRGKARTRLADINRRYEKLREACEQAHDVPLLATPSEPSQPQSTAFRPLLCFHRGASSNGTVSFAVKYSGPPAPDGIDAGKGAAARAVLPADLMSEGAFLARLAQIRGAAAVLRAWYRAFVCLQGLPGSWRIL
eukprot:TRINITY_DN17827_c0_g1_i1.p1 TRINITY_DN17827_c0_g1~~TRINITY_DN17827_c0_g1_i1.p1  ORF type:complete len:697 (+),score=139.35 TRINITY_DN17827_c0_g1_i1:252-2093(+)